MSDLDAEIDSNKEFPFSMGVRHGHAPWFELTQDEVDDIRASTPEGDVIGKYVRAYQKILDIDDEHKRLGLPTLDPPTRYWFRKAREINADSPISAANIFIREVSAAGKILGGIPVGDLQKTSDTIGRTVVEDILNSRRVPPINRFLQADIASSLNIGQQKIEGWGGAFYYWNTPYRKDEHGNDVTVGQDILADPVKYDKFVTINARAAVDAGELEARRKQAVTALLAEVPFGVQLDILDRKSRGQVTVNYVGNPDFIDNYMRNADGTWTTWSKSDGDTDTHHYFTLTADPTLTSRLDAVRKFRLSVQKLGNFTNLKNIALSTSQSGSIGNGVQHHASSDVKGSEGAAPLRHREAMQDATKAVMPQQVLKSTAAPGHQISFSGALLAPQIGPDIMREPDLSTDLSADPTLAMAAPNLSISRYDMSANGGGDSWSLHFRTSDEQKRINNVLGLKNNNLSTEPNQSKIEGLPRSGEVMNVSDPLSTQHLVQSAQHGASDADRPLVIAPRSDPVPAWMDPKSRRELAGVNRPLARDLLTAAEQTGLHFRITQGLRTQTEANQNAATGRGVRDSQHLWGAAADIVMQDAQGRDIRDRAAYQRFADAFEAYSRRTGGHARWLGNLSGRWRSDIVHFDQGIGYGQTHKPDPFGTGRPTEDDIRRGNEEIFRSPDNPLLRRQFMPPPLRPTFPQLDDGKHYADERDRGFAAQQRDAERAVLPRRAPVTVPEDVPQRRAELGMRISGLDDLREAHHHVDALHRKLAGLGSVRIDVRHSGFGDRGDHAPGAVRMALNGNFGSDGRAFS